MSSKDKKKTIKFEQELHWHFIHDYLRFLHHIPIAFTDNEFVKLLKKLEDYIGDKLKTPPNGESLRTYVVEEVELLDFEN